MKISDKDKKLLLILLIGLILFGAYKLNGIFSESLEENEKLLKERNARYTDLLAKSARRKVFIDDTESSKVQYKELLAGYKNSLSQEQSLVFLGLVEKATGVWLKQVGFTQISNVYKFGNVTSSNPATPGQKVYSSDYQGISTSMTLAYECSYADLKTVLKYLEDYGKKATISTVSFTYNEATDTVTGTMQMSLYSIVGSDRPVEDVKINDVAVGTDNIFSSDTFISSGVGDSYKDKIINDYDLYFIMNEVGSDLSNMAIGMANDPMNEATVTSDSTGREEVEIIIRGVAGDYKVSYKIGTKIYPVSNYDEGKVLVCGDSLDMVMISRPRAHQGDTTYADIKIINQSDMPLNIVVINDDGDANGKNKRINFTEKTGLIRIYE